MWGGLRIKGERSKGVKIEHEGRKEKVSRETEEKAVKIIWMNIFKIIQVKKKWRSKSKVKSVKVKKEVKECKSWDLEGES